MSGMKRYANPRGTLLIIVIAVIMMLALHLVRNGGALRPQPETPAHFKTSLSYSEPGAQDYAAGVDLDEAAFEEIVAAYGTDEVYGPPVSEDMTVEAFVEDVYTDARQPKIEIKIAPDYQPLVVTGKPKIAIVIDDMGVDRKRSFEVLEMDAPLTLAFLPYASGLESIAAKAAARGHELMIHMPMQAMTNPVSLGPIAIKTGMDEDTVKENMRAAFESFDGYVGVNNHMGSKVTQNPELMDWVMESVGQRGLYFIDSKTIGSSVAADASRQNGLPTAVRDVFLDHENTAAFVRGALRKTEEIAARKGYAIAIGHPKDVTIEGLRAWLPDAQRRGFEIVHAGRLVERPKGGQVAALLAAEPKSKRLAKAEPAAGKEMIQDEPAEKAAQEAESALAPAVDISADDPNSAQSREAILKKMLGQD